MIKQNIIIINILGIYRKYENKHEKDSNLMKYLVCEKIKEEINDDDLLVKIKDLEIKEYSKQ